MSEWKVPVQSLIDHIKTAVDVDPWAKQMAEELLKEQEAVKPILEQDSMVCGVCGHEVIWQKMLGDGIWADEELDYCPHCGRKVKWDECSTS